MALACCDICGKTKDTFQPHRHEFDYVGEVDKDYICPISFQPLFEPVESRCEHPVSEIEMNMWLKEKNSCPVCREEFGYDFFMKKSHRLVRAKLDALLISCPHCQTHLARASLASHLALCIEAPIFCSTNKKQDEDDDEEDDDEEEEDDEDEDDDDDEEEDEEDGGEASAAAVKKNKCDAVFCRKDLDAHLETCPFVEVPCPVEGCPKVGQRRCLAMHMNNCGYVKVTCKKEKCGAVILRKDVKSHEKLCPFTEAVCSFSFDGAICGHRCLNMEMQQHHAECLLRKVVCERCGESSCASKFAQHDCVSYLLQQLQKAKTEGTSEMHKELRMSKWALRDARAVMRYKQSAKSLRHVFAGEVSEVVFSPAANIFCTTSAYDKKAKVFSLSSPPETTELKFVLPEHKESFKYVRPEISPDGMMFLLASGKKIFQYQKFLTTQKIGFVGYFEAHQNDIVGLTFTSNGKYLLSCDSHSVNVWDTTTWRCVYQFFITGRYYVLTSIACTQDMKYVFCGQEDEVLIFKVESWETNKWTKLDLKMKTHRPLVQLVVSPDDKYLAVMSNTVLQCYEIADWTCVYGRSLEDYEDAITGVVFTPYSKYLIFSHFYNKLEILDVDDNFNTCRILDGPVEDERFRGLSISPGGERIIVASSSGCVRFWDSF